MQENMICLQSRPAQFETYTRGVEIASVQVTFYMAYLGIVRYVSDRYFYLRIIHTSSSILWLWPRNGCDQSCTDARYQEPEGRQGWDPSASSKWKAGLSKVMSAVIIYMYKERTKRLTLRDRQRRRPLVS